MIYELPIASDTAFFSSSYDLDGTTYRLTFRWNVREEAWYMDIATFDDTLIAGGLKMVTNQDISRRFRAKGAPKGAIFILGESIYADKPGRNDLGKRVKILYLDEAEVNYLKAL